MSTVENQIKPSASPIPKRKLRDILYYLAAFFMPSILLFNLYNRNRVENHIVFEHLLIVAGAFAIGGLLVFIIFKCVSGSIEGALLLSIIFWLCFWLFEIIFSFAVQYSTALSNTGLMILLIMGLAFVAIFFRRYEPPFSNIRPAFNVLALSLIVMFILNLTPAVNHELALSRGRADREFYIKQDFVVDATLPNPDIYWVHVDGMMSMETVESFWGECLNWLRDELYVRGFVVYPNSSFLGGQTTFSMPALLSPTFYDQYFSQILEEHKMNTQAERGLIVNEILTADGISLENDVFRYQELFSALSLAGYDFVLHRGSFPTGVVQSIDRLQAYKHGGYIYSTSTDMWQTFLRTDLPLLLNLTTPLDIPEPNRQVFEIRENSNYAPSFFWASIFSAHAKSWHHFDPMFTELTIESQQRYYRYPIPYEHAARIMLNIIDDILSENPAAVIVLQSDHGFHRNITQTYMISIGYSLEQVLELVYSSFSAVRIPPEYGGLDTPIAPLNIARELVNRFVGENYTLLPSN